MRVSEAFSHISGLAYMLRDADMQVRCPVCHGQQWLSQAKRVDLDPEHTTYICWNDCGVIAEVAPRGEMRGDPPLAGYFEEGKDWIVFGADLLEVHPTRSGWRPSHLVRASRRFQARLASLVAGQFERRRAQHKPPTAESRVEAQLSGPCGS